MQTSDCVNDLAAALAAFHSQVSNPENTRTATIEGETKAGKPFSYSYGYSDLSGITDATRRHLADNGLSVTQELIVDGERIGARLRLLHSSGQWIEYEPVWMPAGGGPKDWGAARPTHAASASPPCSTWRPPETTTPAAPPRVRPAAVSPGPAPAR